MSEIKATENFYDYGRTDSAVTDMKRNSTINYIVKVVSYNPRSKIFITE